ncbi:MAG: hypothetical protein J5I90_15775 [Caldilineales bacterium]|nr:hypothetical protein [Caldilineales bacterium]
MNQTPEIQIQRKRKTASRIAWTLAGLVVGVALAALPLDLQRTPPDSLSALIDALAWGLAIPAVFAILAALIISRQPGNRVGWLMMLVGVTAVLPADTILFMVAPARPTALTPGLWLLATTDNWGWVPMIFAVFLIPLHFPRGRPPSPGWRWVNWLAIALGIFFVALISLTNVIGPFNESWQLPNPVGFIPIEFLNGAFLIFWGIGLMTIILGSIASLFVRYRRAATVEREQIKWLLYAAAFFAIAYGLTFFLTDPNASGDSWGNLLLTTAVLALPIAIAIAILRYRLYDIDIIIRKTLQYGVLTAMLALVYFGLIVLLQTLFGQATGEQSPIIIVVSTLVIAALFTPLRRRVQDVIDRRFYRKKYDAQQVLADFARHARDETDLENLVSELVRVVEETMQPERVGVWLKGERR